MKKLASGAGAACVVLLLLAGFRPQQSPASLILGTWHGTSTCVDRKVDTSCHDEEVIYDVDSAGSPRGPVRMRADKVVNGVREEMGAFTLVFDSIAHSWSADLKTARIQARWTFAPDAKAMTGTLKELPSGRLIRRVATQRVTSK